MVGPLGPTARWQIGTVHLSDKGFWRETLALAREDPAGGIIGLAGSLGVVVAMIDLFTPFELPEDVPDEVFLFALSTVLLGVYTTFRLLRKRDKEVLQRGARHDLLLSKVEQLVNDVELRQVTSAEINGLLTGELSTTIGWWFRGGSGRWFRNEVLPALAKRRDAQPVFIQILDPRDEYLCSRYSTYRSQQRDPADIRHNESDPRAIQADLLACILSALVHAAHSRIDEQIVLLRTYSPMRVDMGSSMLLATVASRTAPALMAKANSFFYKSLKDEFESAAHGHAVLRSTLDPRQIPRPEQMTAESARLVLAGSQVSVGQEPPTLLLSAFAQAKDLDFEDIYRKAFVVTT